MGWLQLLWTCLAITLERMLPVACLFGRCGQIYGNTFLNKSPTFHLPCSKIDFWDQTTNCLKCIGTGGCRWCEKEGSTRGTCMKVIVEPGHTPNCGVKTHNCIIAMKSFPYTWTYASCPSINECREEVDNCDKKSETCRDLDEGYICLCKDGYTKASPSSRCSPVCRGCANGRCHKPNECTCNLGWTGMNCTVECECNGHSDCANETSKDICLNCTDNTQGEHCEECKPFFVGNPSNGNKCESCISYCNGNAKICVTKDEYAKVQNFSTLRPVIKKGSTTDNVVCVNCTNFSTGRKCDVCIDGYFLFNENCTKCQCNGHSDTCNRRTGLECKCTHDTNTDTSLSPLEQLHKQCAICNTGYAGNPENGRPCYKKIDLSREGRPVIEKIFLQHGKAVYFFITPSYLNVDIQFTMDVYNGDVDVYLTSNRDRFLMYDSENSVQELTAGDKVITYDYNTSPAFVRFTTYNETDSILFIKGVRSRMVVIIPHDKHDFQLYQIYIVVSCINSTIAERSHATVHIRQDQTKLSMTLFLLTLLVILMLILSAFIFGLKIRARYTRERFVNELIEFQATMKKPIATYYIACELNEDIRIFKMLRNSSNEHKLSDHSLNTLCENKSCVDSTSICNFNTHITPIVSQYTGNCLASVTTVILQHPSNEISSWNISLASGLFQANPQDLIQMKSEIHYSIC